MNQATARDQPATSNVLLLTLRFLVSAMLDKKRESAKHEHKA